MCGVTCLVNTVTYISSRYRIEMDSSSFLWLCGREIHLGQRNYGWQGWLVGWTVGSNLTSTSSKRYPLIHPSIHSSLLVDLSWNFGSCWVSVDFWLSTTKNILLGYGARHDSPLDCHLLMWISAFGHDEEIGGFGGAIFISRHLQERNVKLEYLLDEGIDFMSYSEY